MGYDVKGITIEIGANATSLTETLRNIENQYKGLDATARQLKRSMSFSGADLSSLNGSGEYARLLSAQIQESRDKAKAFEDVIANWDKQIEQWNLKLQEAFANVSKYSQELDKAKEEVAKFSTEQEKAGQNLDRAKTALKETETSIAQYEKSLNTATREHTKLESSVTTLQNKFERESTKLAELTTKLSDLNAKYEDGKMKTSTYESRLESLNSKIEQQKTKVESARDALNTAVEAESKAKQVTEEYANTIESLNQKRSREEVALQNAQKSYDQVSSKVRELKDREKELEQQLKLSESAVKQYQQNLETQDQSLLRLKADLASTRNELQQYIETQKQLATMENPFARVMNGISQTTGNLSQTFSNVANETRALSLASGSVLGYAAKQVINYEDAWAGVTKTVDGTPKQMSDLNNQLKELATTTASSYQEIAQFAELAGQMGVAVDDVAGFTKTITQLSDTTDIQGENAAQTLAQFANIMVDKGGRNVDYYERLGSTIVDLGNNFATTENDIMEMASRMATAGRATGMTSQEVLALATSLSSVGIKAAAGGGSMSKLMSQIQLAVSTGSESLGKYASVSGKTSKQFVDDWKTNAGQAFADFVTGIGNTGDVTATLDELGIKEVRMANGVRALAQSSDLFKDAMTRSNSAWSENTAMAAEAEKRYNTLGSQLKQTKETLSQAAETMGQELVPYMKSGANELKSFAKWFSNLNSSSKKTAVSMLAVGTAISPVSKILSGATRVVSSFTGGMSRLAGGFSAFKTLRNDGLSFAEALTAVTSKSALVTAGIAATGATLAGVVALSAQYKNNLIQEARELDTNRYQYDALSEAQRNYTNTAKAKIESSEQTIQSWQQEAQEIEYASGVIRELGDKTNLTATEKIRLADAVERLKQIFPELDVSIENDTGTLQGNTKELLNNIEALKENARQRALISAVGDKTVALESEKIAYEAGTETIRYYKNELDEATKVMNEMREGGKGSTEEFKKQCGLVEYLSDEWNTAKESLSSTTQEMSKLNAEIMNLNNSAETGDGTVLGESLKTQLDTLAQSFTEYGKENGVQFNSGFIEGINSTSGDVQAQIGFLANMETLQGLTDEAGMIGGMIPMNMAMGMLANAGTLEEATMELNRLLSFIDMMDEAGLSGQQIPEKIAQGIMDNSISPENAIALMKTGVGAAAKEVGDEAKAKIEETDTESAGNKMGEKAVTGFENGVKPLPEKAGQAISDVEAKFSSGASTTGAAATMWGQSAYNAATPQFSSLSTYCNEQISSVNKNLDSLIAKASNPIKINVEYNESRKSSGASKVNRRYTGIQEFKLQPESAPMAMSRATARNVGYGDLYSLTGKAGVANESAEVVAQSLDTLSTRMSKLESIQTTLEYIAENLPMNISMDGFKVGEITASGVRKRNAEYEHIQAVLKGAV